MTGATGGVGSIAVQLCRYFGSRRILATAGSAGSLDYLLTVLKVPEEDIIRHPGRTLEELVDEARSKNDGKLVRVAFDFVGHRMKHLCLRAIGFGGSVVLIVEEPGDFDVALFDGRTSPLFAKSASLHFEFLGARALFGQPGDWAAYNQQLEALCKLYQSRGHSNLRPSPTSAVSPRRPSVKPTVASKRVTSRANW